jgi:hypothetical protein
MLETVEEFIRRVQYELEDDTFVMWETGRGLQSATGGIRHETPEWLFLTGDRRPINKARIIRREEI